jgi:hypothetical protein
LAAACRFPFAFSSQFSYKLLRGTTLPNSVLLLTLANMRADLRVLELEVVLEFVAVHDARRGDPILLQNQVLLIEVATRAMAETDMVNNDQ